MIGNKGCFMKLSESNLEFDFVGNITATKFDDTDFYKKSFQHMPNAKGVDFIAISNETIIFIEVKNCKGHESDNRYRIEPNNRKISTAPTSVDVTDKESLDIEVSKKVAMSLACLVGAHTKPQFQNSDELKPYSLAMMRPEVAKGNKSIKVLLFLEGDFESRTRSKKAIMYSLADSIKKKLSWLNCQVFVEDSTTQSRRFFTATNL